MMNVDTDTAHEYMTEKGIEVYFPTDEEQKLWDDYGASLYSQFEESYGKELMDEVVGIVDGRLQSKTISIRPSIRIGRGNQTRGRGDLRGPPAKPRAGQPRPKTMPPKGVAM